MGKTNDRVGYIAKRFLMVAICTTILIITQLVMTTQTTGNRNIRGSVFKWDDSPWTLADDDELISTGGEIEQSQHLSGVLSNNGINPDTIKSMDFTKATSTYDTAGMLSGFASLQKIIKLNKLDYLKNAEQMFQDSPVLTDIDIQHFELLWSICFECGC